jgi:prevent-host-death family protein
MNKIVTASEANRQFSKLLREVKKGNSVIVTNHGEAVAKVVPVDRKDVAARDRDAAARDRAWRALLKRLRQQKPMNAGSWTRDELYEDDPK